MSKVILRCGSLVVRSPKATERIRQAKNNKLEVNKAKYQVSGLSATEIKLLGDQETLTLKEDEDGSLETEAKQSAIFFDQTHYTFSIHLKEAVEAWIFSPIDHWCEAADWDSDSKKLNFPVNFGNDLGDFEICWEWLNDQGERFSGSFAGQVFSTKLDIYSDFKLMLEEVKNRFQWIQLDLLRQTTWGWGSDSDAEATLKSWLVIFQQVRQGMERRFHKLLTQHRRKLVSEVHLRRPDQIKKIGHRLEERVAEGLLDNPNRRYPVSRKVLDADTPENRYMKHILQQTLAQLNEVIEQIRDVKRISDLFKARLDEWADGLGRLKQHRFWRGIGAFHGLRKESLILSQDPLYAGIRRDWFLLQHGLSLLRQDLRGGIQNAAQLYEVWCLVKLDQMLNARGWKNVSISDSLSLERAEDDFDEENEELHHTGSVKFEYKHSDAKLSDLQLLFQPTANANPNRNEWDGMMSVPVVQRPDIVLRLTRNDLPSKPTYTWIFDAKYRINSGKNGDKSDAPDDAVNQMHRYRDAILWDNETLGGRLTRESIGAFVLYPGNEPSDDSKPSAQITSIEKTNIGAFPFKPSKEDSFSSKVLSQKLTAWLPTVDNTKGLYDMMDETEMYHASVPTVKKPLRGHVIVCATRGKMRSKAYWENCRLYRIPKEQVDLSTLKIDEWEFIAPAKNNEVPYGLFPILKIHKPMKRTEIIKFYDRKNVVIEDRNKRLDEEYYLFELGEPIEGHEMLEPFKGDHKVINVRELNISIKQPSSEQE